MGFLPLLPSAAAAAAAARSFSLAAAKAAAAGGSAAAPGLSSAARCRASNLKISRFLAGGGGGVTLSAANMASAPANSDPNALCKVSDPKKADNIYAFRAFNIDGKLIDLEVRHRMMTHYVT